MASAFPSLTTSNHPERVATTVTGPLLEGPASAEADCRYQLFAMAWAVAALFHMAQLRVFVQEPRYVLLTLAALALLLRPRTVPLLLPLAGVQLYDTMLQMPFASNHWLFTAFVNLTILHAYLSAAISRRTLRPAPVDLLALFAPVVRLEVILLYFFVVLHKLNTSFFAPDVSCGALLFRAQHLDVVLPVTTLTVTLNIYLTLVIETLIPVLLIFRRTRWLGLWLGLLFHGVIAFNSYNGFYDFSSMIFAVYMLFAGPAFGRTAATLYQSGAATVQKLRQGLRAPNFRRVAGLLALGLLAGLLVGGALLWVKDAFQVLWAAYCLVIFGILLRAGQPAAGAGLRWWLPQAALALWPALLLLNGVCPYLGLKTESSFAMFSNLRTEGGITNHAFIPASTQVFGYQRDVVEVLSSSDRQLQQQADRGFIVPYLQFKNYVATARPNRVEYRRNGAPHTFQLASAQPTNELLHRSPLLLRKLLGFRAISKTAPQPCQH